MRRRGPCATTSFGQSIALRRGEELLDGPTWTDTDAECIERLAWESRTAAPDKDRADSVARDPGSARLPVGHSAARVAAGRARARGCEGADVPRSLRARELLRALGPCARVRRGSDVARADGQLDDAGGEAASLPGGESEPRHLA